MCDSTGQSGPPAPAGKHVGYVFWAIPDVVFHEGVSGAFGENCGEGIRGGQPYGRRFEWKRRKWCSAERMPMR